jgi:isopenicillin N synthase-like dioxygenase
VRSSSIPTLDIGSFRQHETAPRSLEFVADLRSICHEHGFFHLTGHGIDPTTTRRLHTLARDFFALPDRDRLQIANIHSPQFRGYTPVEHEYTQNRPDRREQLDIGRELPPPDLGPRDPAWLRLRGPNLWPAALPDLRPVTEAWMTAMESLGRLLCHALALALGQPADRFDEMVTPHPEVLVKIIRYPGSGDAQRQGVGAHRDTGLVTFVAQDEHGGLQVQLGDEWIDVAPQADAFVVNLGEMMQLVTSGYFAATVHRVISPLLPADRVSLAYFFNPKLESTLSPLTLPPELAAAAPGGASREADNPILASYGDNSLKVRLRAHPDVARRHHADLLN